MKESEDQLRMMMIDKIPTLAWSCLPDGTVEFLNQRWLEYTGLSLEEALGWGWKVAIHPEDLEKLMATWLGLFASGEPGEEEARLRRFDGAKMVKLEPDAGSYPPVTILIDERLGAPVLRSNGQFRCFSRKFRSSEGRERSRREDRGK